MPSKLDGDGPGQVSAVREVVYVTVGVNVPYGEWHNKMSPCCIRRQAGECFFCTGGMPKEFMEVSE